MSIEQIKTALGDTDTEVRGCVEDIGKAKARLESVQGMIDADKEMMLEHEISLCIRELDSVTARLDNL